jgi:hypothetical protein
MFDTMPEAQQRTRETLTDIAVRQNKQRGAFSKNHLFYGIYERYFQSLRDKPLIVLEVGVYEGESTRVFSEYFKNSRILAVDNQTLTDFRDFPNISFHEFSQTDGERWASLLDEHAPDGVDIIIDDASHVGFFSQITFCHLFSRLKPGGLYVVEDWGSGYFPNHVDGAPFVPTLPGGGGEELPKQIKSHDHGMVGFVKWLVDLQGSQDIILGGGEPPPFGGMPFEYLHLYHGTAVAKKASLGG